MWRMARWTRVCCAIDFSEPSVDTLREAARLARRDGAGLTLVHVFAPPQTVAPELGTLMPEQLEAAIRAELAPRLAAAKAEAEAAAPGVPVDTVLLAGRPAHEIVALAEARGIDLVVVGTHGRTGLRRAVLGSVAEHVVRSAPCPVLVFRRHEAWTDD
jgi:nucleotide-binding universal stress UspA family protein